MFWELSDDYRFEADWDEGVELDQVICPLNPGHRRAGKRITDLRVVLPHRKVPDFFWVHDCVIQDRVLQLFREAGFTGFDVRPVNARFKNSAQEVPILWELRVTGWGGMAGAESGIKLIKHCPGCGMLRYSGTDHPELIIDEGQWDGSDFFMVWPLPRFIFVTDRVAEVVRDHRLSGVNAQPPAVLNLSRGFGPGRLSDWMDKERAHQLGDPLGIY